jgi:hypothetical protein
MLLVEGDLGGGFNVALMLLLAAHRRRAVGTSSGLKRIQGVV